VPTLTVLDRQFLKELTLNLVFTFAVITTIAVFAIATVAFYQLPDLGLSTYVELVRYGLVQALPFLLPLSLLIAVVFVYGRAAADHEITTLKASGIHPYRVVLPGVLIALLLVGVGLEVENYWAPWALYQQRRIPEQQEGLKTLLERRMARGETMVQFGDRSEGRSISWKEFEITDAGVELKNVLLEQQEEPRPGDARPREPVKVHAERAVVSFDERQRRIVLRLVRPQVLAGPAREARQDELVLSYPLDSESSRTRLKFQTGPELLALAARAEESVELGGEQQSLLRRFERDEVVGRIHERLSRAATPIVFLLLGVPLALVFRSGNRLVAFLLASLIAMFVYYPTERLANVLMSQRLAGPVVACWSDDFLLAAIGAGLLLFVVKR